MATESGRSGPRRVTARGAATRDRIVEAAHRVIAHHGVGGATLAAVRLESGTSRSQLYQYFDDKEALVEAVIEYRAAELLEHQRTWLGGVGRLDDLDAWADELIALNEVESGAFGCPLGSIANELSERGDRSRGLLAGHFDEWMSLLVAALDRLTAARVLRADADTRALAAALLASLQGGYLLAQAARDVYPMRVALRSALQQVRSFEEPVGRADAPSA